MSLTRAKLEAVLIRRVGKLLAAADLDGTTDNGSNADLNDPIGYAIRQCGGTVADLSMVASADVGSVASGDLDKLLDLAELRALESALGNYDDVTIRVGQRQESLSDTAKQLETAIGRKRAQVERDYGFGVGSLQAGVIDLAFAEQNESDA